MVSLVLAHTTKPVPDDRLVQLLPEFPVQELAFKYANFQTSLTAIPILTTSIAPSLVYLGFWLEGPYLTPETQPLWLDFFRAADHIEHVDLRRNENWPLEFTEAVLHILVSKPKLSQLQLAGVSLSPGSLHALMPLFVGNGPSSVRATRKSTSSIFEVTLTNTRPSL